MFRPEFVRDRPDIFNGDESTRKKAITKYFFSSYCVSDKTCSKKWEVEYNWLKTLLTDQQTIDYIRMMYDTRIAQLDHELATIFTYLATSGLLNNTIVVITSSHGEEFNEHGGFAHENKTYKELIHTPLIFYVPRLSHRTVTTLSENIDIMPTLFALTGIPAHKPMQGVSQVETMLGKASRKKYAVSGDFYLTGVISVEDKQWKLVRTEKENIELYDLKNDPKELHDVAQNHPDISEALLKTLISTISQRNPYPSPSPQPTPTWLDESTRERLIRDGYF